MQIQRWRLLPRTGIKNDVILKELIGVFGGVVGLCMGFSLLSGAEFIYFFTLRLYIVHVDRSNESDIQALH